ncbi:hypothetical protein [Actinopolymorpha cephalotaxi]|uniref:Uncharacterized protein n=1 Tax=Actinopolymorpha cephalotaxi TaxID=504797 RepID=A0ABX2SA41_9ACTN|nr:hypothetical protein [Actinopolymorpha cephalotaxi]NYH85382.1 hypothetical protein [Actinopolymorpha cephalotaxi]
MRSDVGFQLQVVGSADVAVLMLRARDIAPDEVPRDLDPEI